MASSGEWYEREVGELLDAVIGSSEYVEARGPIRNMDITKAGGPDMRYTTLEDLYGASGNTFQAAIGFVNFEGTQANQARQSYGVAVDDMVVKWREFSLDPDATDCAVEGSCAALEYSTSNVFQGQTVLTMARRLHPGQRNSLDALCRRYEIDNSQRELHGALLDAEILADVYLTMTGGQASLSLDSRGAAQQEGGAGIRRLGKDRPVLPVIRPTGDELAAHEARLEAIDKSCGGEALWRNL